MNKCKQITVLVLALAMLLTMAACGGKSTKDYTAEVQTIMDEIDANNEASLTVDFTDEEATKKYCDETRAIYQKFVDLKAPDEFADNDAKLKGSAQSMFEYLDALPEYLKLESGSEEGVAKRTELMNVYVQALSQLAEGTSGMDITQNNAGTSGEATTEGAETSTEASASTQAAG